MRPGGPLTAPLVLAEPLSKRELLISRQHHTMEGDQARALQTACGLSDLKSQELLGFPVDCDVGQSPPTSWMMAVMDHPLQDMAPTGLSH